MRKRLNIGFFKKRIKHTDIAEKNLPQKKLPSNLRLYRSIDELPVRNFRKAFKDSRYIYKLEDYSKLPKTYPNDLWDDIFWEYLDEKGIDNNAKLRLELKAKLAILENEEIFEGKKNGVKIMVTNERLKSLEIKEKKNLDTENDIILWRFMGSKVDPKTTTVKEYIALEKLLIESNKNASSNNR